MTSTNRRADGQAADSLLAHARSTIDSVLRGAVGTLLEPMDRMAAYHFGWLDTEGSPAAGPNGKGLRPALTLAAARACHGDPAAARNAAAAVELLHNFTLIHDDIMDADPRRHNRPTVWRVWGESSAILLGDALLALAMRVVVDDAEQAVVAQAVTELSDTTITLCSGQHEDCAFEQRTVVGIEDYLSMAERKTGALMASACALGSLYGGADRSAVSRLHTFGKELGVAFQLIDDMIGVWGNPGATGKPVGGDLARRKKSFPVICTLTSGTADAEHLATLYRKPESMSESDIETATGLLERAGSREHCWQYAARRVSAALAALPAGIDTAELESLVFLATYRDR